jgi:two-component system sensor histidine kinase PilS (NtrC family)
MIPAQTMPKNDQQQNLALLNIYTIYRICLCLALLGAFFLLSDEPLVGHIKPEQFFYSTSTYLLLNVIGFFFILPKTTTLNNNQLFSNFLLDVAFIIAIADSSNGVGSGLGLLLVVIVAASGILLSSQLALLIAAIASIAIIADTARLISEGYLNLSNFLPAGLLGMVFFITSLLIQNLANRIRGANIIAEQRALDVSQLQSLNQSIVQRMRTGILVSNREGRVQLANAAASELLGDTRLQYAPKNSGTYENDHYNLPKELLAQFHQWQQTPQYLTPAFRPTATGPELHASFSALNSEDVGDVLIFLEDNRRLAQQAQQMKLASLGRLTASIAHEIRNPLGAISHAAQLLAESEDMITPDQRLCEIIERHSKRMNNVIENVLELSRRSAPKSEKIVLKKWLQQFIDEFKNTDDDDFKISLSGDDRCEVTTDCTQLTQVISNLAQNGLRYSRQETGKATLQLDSHINPNTGLPVLDIIDDGVGIAQPDQKNLFEPFYTTETKGSGLGLYISRELCEANEARLDYIRTDNNRSCFRISFPHPDRRLSPE